MQKYYAMWHRCNFLQCFTDAEMKVIFNHAKFTHNLTLFIGTINEDISAQKLQNEKYFKSTAIYKCKVVNNNNLDQRIFACQLFECEF